MFSKKGIYRALSTVVTLTLVFGGFPVFTFTAQAADTGFKSPTSNASNNIGTGDDWSDPTKAYSNGSGAATEVNGEKHRFYDFSFGILSGATINGIEVAADAWSTSDEDSEETSVGANAVGNYNQWSETGVSGSGNAQTITAVSSNDGDSTYITEGTNGEAQTFLMNNAGIPAGSTIDSVKLKIIAKEDNGNAVIKLRVENGTGIGQQSDGGAENLTGSYVEYGRTMTTNPLTGNAWTLTEVNNWTTKFGVVRTNSNSATPRVTKIWVEINYTKHSTECRLGVDLSWNGGSTWTSEKTQNLTETEATYTIGGSSDTWGRTWSDIELSNSNFRLRVHDIDSGSNCIDDSESHLDWVRVKVHYTEPDTTDPETTITSNPTNPSSSSDASFSFSSNEVGTFTCKLDTGAEEACSSPKNYSELSDGSHTFSVYATDTAGNKDETPATYTWTISTVIPSATIIATKIVCDSEEDLPNWSGSGMDINASTAADFVEENENCHLESGWHFQWAPTSASNPGDNTGAAGSPWTAFGPTNDSGVASVSVPMSSVDESGQVWMREVWSADYIPFSGEFVSGSSISAEMWCDGDVLNYDNLDYARGLTNGATTYCVAFNVEQPLACEPQVELVQNGGFESPAGASGTWTLATFGGALIWGGNIIPSADLEQTTEGLEVQSGGTWGAPHGGNQLAELDGYHPTTIYQDIETIPGKEYKLSYFFSPRPNTAAEENQLEVSVEDSVVANHTGTTEGGETQWTEYTKNFVATDNMTRIRFTENGPDDVGGGVGSYLDDVSLKCIGTPVDQCPGVEGIQLTNAQCSGGGGSYKPPTPPQCANGMDDDGDGLTDAYDPGCHAGDIITGLMNPDDNDESTPPPPAVLGAATSTDEGSGTGSTTPEVLPPPPAPSCTANGEYITEYMGKGKKNNPEQVKKLQEFLNMHMNAGLTVNGEYDNATFEAVKAFQLKHAEEVLGPWVKGKFMSSIFATGYVYKTTKRWINMIMCSELNLPVPQLP
jgi:hypothetical protein